MNSRTVVAIAMLMLAGCSGRRAVHQPRWMVCANDQRFSMSDGLNRVAENPGSGSLTIMDVSGSPLRSVEYLEGVPCSLVGPPTCVAITPDQNYALVASAMKQDPENPAAQIPDNRLSVVRLLKGAHQVVQTLQLGKQPSGVDISPDGTRALVTNRGEGSLSLLSIDSGGAVRLTGTFPVAEAGSSLSHVAFSPDGSQALATLHSENAVLLLSLENDRPSVLSKLTVDKGPYAVEFLPDGRYAAVAHTSGGTVFLLEVHDGALKKVDASPVGLIPEGLDISPDGNWMAVNCLNNSYWAAETFGWREKGQLILMQKQHGVFVTVDVVPVGSNPQAVSFTPDSRYIAVGSNGDHQIEFFKVGNNRLKKTGVNVSCPGGPAALRISN